MVFGYFQTTNNITIVIYHKTYFERNNKKLTKLQKIIIKKRENLKVSKLKSSTLYNIVPVLCKYYLHLIRSKQFLSNRAYSAELYFYEPCAYIYKYTYIHPLVIRLRLSLPSEHQWWAPPSPAGIAQSNVSVPRSISPVVDTCV